MKYLNLKKNQILAIKWLVVDQQEYVNKFKKSQFLEAHFTISLFHHRQVSIPPKLLSATITKQNKIHPLLGKQVCPSPKSKKGRTHSPAGEGVGGIPIQTTGDKA